jgi:hypothetical protein
VSRGLGKLQRTIKQLIYEQRARFEEESERIQDVPKCPFWLTWSDIRVRLWRDLGEPDPHSTYWLGHERAAKRALYTLWKRKEIGRIRLHERYCYITAECWKESFSPESEEQLRQHLEKMAAAESNPADVPDPAGSPGAPLEEK